jgi:Tfp pilus assembly protein PilZ
MADKQAHPRKRARIMVRFGVNGLERGAYTTNISLSGAFLRTNRVYRPGTTLQVEFDFPAQKFSHWAQVVWAKKVPAQLAHTLLCGMGVRFINPGAEWESVFEEWKGPSK